MVQRNSQQRQKVYRTDIPPGICWGIEWLPGAIAVCRSAGHPGGIGITCVVHSLGGVHPGYFCSIGVCLKDVKYDND